MSSARASIFFALTSSESDAASYQSELSLDQELNFSIIPHRTTIHLRPLTSREMEAKTPFRFSVLSTYDVDMKLGALGALAVLSLLAVMMEVKFQGQFHSKLLRQKE